jgi:hypothetical protein
VILGPESFRSLKIISNFNYYLLGHDSFYQTD